jgi:hypothetical protein
MTIPKIYNQFENTLRHLQICSMAINDAIDNGTGLDKFKSMLMSDYERDCFLKLREQCIRFVDLYDELDTIP